MNDWAQIVWLLRKLHKSPKYSLEWLFTPHAELLNRTPISLMLDGRALIVRNMLEAAYYGLPT